ncbi:hypothetical protein GGQ92_002900 [Gracilibacillus halotolerans]|uniref:NETI protein n=1 Tax=Gracilibacillus halotolerans TaxID=74386 RepID=A0A841RNL1_9BACI|nr:hypothetical protein [Gracilibacillus halotolerans]
MSKKQKKQKKKKFEVGENETIEECLNRMKKEGYTPTRRIEKPIFREEGNSVIPVDKTVIFEAVALESEH